MASSTIIKMWRHLNGWTAEEVGRKGVSRWTYTKIENGTYKASIKAQRQIAEIFGVRPHFLFNSRGLAYELTPKDLLQLGMKKRKSLEG